MRLCGFKCGVYLLAILAVAIASPAHEGTRTKREDHCPESKLVVNPNKKATSIKIITESGDTLFSVDSTNTKMVDLEKLISFTNLLFYPEDGKVLFGNSSDYKVIKDPLDDGIELSLVDKMNANIFNKKIKGSNERLLKPDVKCTRISGFKVVVQPDMDVNHFDGYNMTALAWATLFNQSDVAKTLVEKGAQVNIAPTDYVSSPLTNAIAVGNGDIVEYLISHGANLNLQMGEQKVTPLHFAAHKGRLECTKVLLKHGASVSSLDVGDSATPLHYAAAEGHTKVVKELVAKGADVNAKTKGGFSPLHMAAAIGNDELVHILLESGADLNSKNKDDVTPLMMAITHGRSEDSSMKIVKHLVEHHSPDLNMKNKDGKTAMSLADSRKFSKVQAYLQAHGAQ